MDGNELIDVIDPAPVARGWIALGSYGGETVVSEVTVTRSEACVDCDGDGYGDPACSEGARVDCDDYDSTETPAGTEGPYQDPTCEDGIDNDCDGLFDGEDDACKPPEDDDWGLAVQARAAQAGYDNARRDAVGNMGAFLLLTVGFVVVWKGLRRRRG